jgi:hypothetical protein
LNKERQEKEVYRQQLEAQANEFEQKQAEFTRTIELQEIRNTILNKTNASLVESVKYFVMHMRIDIDIYKLTCIYVLE